MDFKPSQQKMKIAFITNICTHFLIKPFELLATKYNIDFYFTGGQEKYWEKKNKLWLGNFSGKYLQGFYIFPKFKIIPSLVFRLLFGNYDVYIKCISDRFALPTTFLVAKAKHKPFIFWTGLWMHPKIFFHKISFIPTKYIYRHSDAIVAYGDHVRRYLVELGISDEKIFCAWQAVDNKIFNKCVSDEEKLTLRKELGLSQEKIVLYVGRLGEGKGLCYLIDAVSMMRDLSINLLFIGEGTLRRELEEKCKKFDVKYRFLSHIQNVELYKYYTLADVFVLPSITTKTIKETWGLVINEAMNQGCPIVATDAVGAAVGGLVQNGRNGFVVPEKNSKKLKEAIECILKDEKLAKSMGECSREIIKNWTYPRMVAGFSEAVDYAVARRGENGRDQRKESTRI